MPGYFPAIEADVKTVMASGNSWNGVKMHGSKTMLPEVLKKETRIYRICSWGLEWSRSNPELYQY